MEGLWTSDVSVSNGDINYLIWKSIFPLKLFCTTVANADTWSLKSLHTLFHTYLDHALAKFEPNRVWPEMYKILKFCASAQKSEFFKTFFDKKYAIFQAFFVADTMLNGKL